MANRRMLAIQIVDSDNFLSMPMSAQCLYMHLALRADDDGFVGNPKKIMRMVSSAEDDMKLLFAKKYVIPFESGVCVIRHWRIHNYIQKDRYTPTYYKEEQKQLGIGEDNTYQLLKSRVDTECIQSVYNLDAQVRLGKESIVQDRVIGERVEKKKPEKHRYGSFKNILLSDEELDKLSKNPDIRDVDDWIEKASGYIEAKGDKYKSHYAMILNWVRMDKERNKPVKVVERERRYDHDDRY